MNDHEALSLLRAAIPSADGEVWADLGAGTGVFTRALAALVGADGRVIAVDRDARALATIRAWAARAADTPAIETIPADVTHELELPRLHGAVMANVLHFIPDAAGVLARVASTLKPGGRVVVIEYEGRRPSPWVPYPVSAARLAELAAAAGLAPPRVVATRPSAYGGELYVAVTTRAET
jgi:ubiquinone/menaquinone biosynthesis C-methylase UbiE